MCTGWEECAIARTHTAQMLYDFSQFTVTDRAIADNRRNILSNRFSCECVHNADIRGKRIIQLNATIQIFFIVRRFFFNVNRSCNGFDLRSVIFIWFLSIKRWKCTTITCYTPKKSHLAFFRRRRKKWNSVERWFRSVFDQCFNLRFPASRRQFHRIKYPYMEQYFYVKIFRIFFFITFPPINVIIIAFDTLARKRITWWSGKVKWLRKC